MIPNDPTLGLSPTWTLEPQAIPGAQIGGDSPGLAQARAADGMGRASWESFLGSGQSPLLPPAPTLMAYLQSRGLTSLDPQSFLAAYPTWSGLTADQLGNQLKSRLSPAELERFQRVMGNRGLSQNPLAMAVAGLLLDAGLSLDQVLKFMTDDAQSLNQAPGSGSPGPSAGSSSPSTSAGGPGGSPESGPAPASAAPPPAAGGSGLANDLPGLESQRNQTQGEIATAEGELRTAEDAVQKAQQECLGKLAGQIEDPQTRAAFVQASQDYQEATRQQAELKNQQGQLRSQLTQARADIQAQEAKKTAGEADVSSFTSQRDSLQQQKAGITDGPDDTPETRASKASRRSALQAQIEAAQRRIDEARKRVEEATAALTTLHNQENELNQRLDELENVLLPQQVERAATALQTMDESRGAGKGDTARQLLADTALKTAQAALRQAQSKLDSLRRRLADIEQKIGQVRSRLERERPPESIQAPADLVTGGPASTLGSDDEGSGQNCWEASATVASAYPDRGLGVLPLEDTSDPTNHAVVVSQDGNWVMFDGSEPLDPPVRVQDYLERNPSYQQFRRPDGAPIGAVDPEVLTNPVRAQAAFQPPQYDPTTGTVWGGELYGIDPGELFDDQPIAPVPAPLTVSGELLPDDSQPPQEPPVYRLDLSQLSDRQLALQLGAAYGLGNSLGLDPGFSLDASGRYLYVNESHQLVELGPSGWTAFDQNRPTALAAMAGLGASDPAALATGANRLLAMAGLPSGLRLDSPTPLTAEQVAAYQALGYQVAALDPTTGRASWQEADAIASFGQSGGPPLYLLVGEPGAALDNARLLAASLPAGSALGEPAGAPYLDSSLQLHLPCTGGELITSPDGGTLTGLSLRAELPMIPAGTVLQPLSAEQAAAMGPQVVAGYSTTVDGRVLDLKLERLEDGSTEWRVVPHENNGAGWETSTLQNLPLPLGPVDAARARASSSQSAAEALGLAPSTAGALFGALDPGDSAAAQLALNGAVQASGLGQPSPLPTGGQPFSPAQWQVLEQSGCTVAAFDPSTGQVVLARPGDSAWEALQAQSDHLPPPVYTVVGAPLTEPQRLALATADLSSETRAQLDTALAGSDPNTAITQLLNPIDPEDRLGDRELTSAFAYLMGQPGGINRFGTVLAGIKNPAEQWSGELAAELYRDPERNLQPVLQAASRAFALMNGRDHLAELAQIPCDDPTALALVVAHSGDPEATLQLFDRLMVRAQSEQAPVFYAAAAEALASDPEALRALLSRPQGIGLNETLTRMVLAMGLGKDDSAEVPEAFRYSRSLGALVEATTNLGDPAVSYQVASTMLSAVGRDSWYSSLAPAMAGAMGQALGQSSERWMDALLSVGGAPDQSALQGDFASQWRIWHPAGGPIVPGGPDESGSTTPIATNVAALRAVYPNLSQDQLAEFNSYASLVDVEQARRYADNPQCYLLDVAVRYRAQQSGATPAQLQARLLGVQALYDQYQSAFTPQQIGRFLTLKPQDAAFMGSLPFDDRQLEAVGHNPAALARFPQNPALGVAYAMETDPNRQAGLDQLYSVYGDKLTPQDLEQLSPYLATVADRPQTARRFAQSPAAYASYMIASAGDLQDNTRTAAVEALYDRYHEQLTPQVMEMFGPVLDGLTRDDLADFPGAPAAAATYLIASRAPLISPDELSPELRDLVQVARTFTPSDLADLKANLLMLHDVFGDRLDPLVCEKLAVYSSVRDAQTGEPYLDRATAELYRNNPLAYAFELDTRLAMRATDPSLVTGLPGSLPLAGQEGELGGIVADYLPAQVTLNGRQIATSTLTLDQLSEAIASGQIDPEAAIRSLQGDLDQISDRTMWDAVDGLVGNVAGLVLAASHGDPSAQVRRFAALASGSFSQDLDLLGQAPSSQDQARILLLALKRGGTALGAMPRFGDFIAQDGQEYMTGYYSNLRKYASYTKMVAVFLGPEVAFLANAAMQGALTLGETGDAGQALGDMVKGGVSAAVESVFATRFAPALGGGVANLVRGFVNPATSPLFASMLVNSPELAGRFGQFLRAIAPSLGGATTMATINLGNFAGTQIDGVELENGQLVLENWPKNQQDWNLFAYGLIASGLSGGVTGSASQTLLARLLGGSSGEGTQAVLSLMGSIETQSYQGFISGAALNFERALASGRNLSLEEAFNQAIKQQWHDTTANLGENLALAAVLHFATPHPGEPQIPDMTRPTEQAVRDYLMREFGSGENALPARDIEAAVQAALRYNLARRTFPLTATTGAEQATANQQAMESSLGEGTRLYRLDGSVLDAASVANATSEGYYVVYQGPNGERVVQQVAVASSGQPLELDPVDIIGTIRRNAPGEGWTAVGGFHNHPDGQSAPSQADLALEPVFRGEFGEGYQSYVSRDGVLTRYRGEGETVTLARALEGWRQSGVSIPQLRQSDVVGDPDGNHAVLGPDGRFLVVLQLQGQPQLFEGNVAAVGRFFGLVDGEGRQYFLDAQTGDVRLATLRQGTYEFYSEQGYFKVFPQSGAVVTPNEILMPQGNTTLRLELDPTDFYHRGGLYACQGETGPVLVDPRAGTVYRVTDSGPGGQVLYDAGSGQYSYLNDQGDLLPVRASDGHAVVLASATGGDLLVYPRNNLAIELVGNTGGPIVLLGPGTAAYDLRTGQRMIGTREGSVVVFPDGSMVDAQNGVNLVREDGQVLALTPQGERVGLSALTTVSNSLWRSPQVESAYQDFQADLAAGMSFDQAYQKLETATRATNDLSDWTYQALEATARAVGTEEALQAALQANPLGLGLNHSGEAGGRRIFLQTFTDAAFQETLALNSAAYADGTLNVLEPGVTGVSPEVLAAMGRLASSPYFSSNPFNNEHMREVFVDALTGLARPVSQQQLDRLFVETMTTDMLGKSLSPSNPDHLNLPIVPVVANGRTLTTTGELWEAMRAGNPDLQPWTFGVAMHGLLAPPFYEQIYALLPESAGVSLDSGALAALYGHHFSAYPTKLIGEALPDFALDFQPLAEQGLLSASDAQGLTHYAQAARDFYPLVERQLSGDLTPEAMATLLSSPEGVAYRQALESLPEEARAQLLADSSQFRPLALSKWSGVADPGGVGRPNSQAIGINLAQGVRRYALEYVAQHVGAEATPEAVRAAFAEYFQQSGALAYTGLTFDADNLTVRPMVTPEPGNPAYEMFVGSMRQARREGRLRVEGVPGGQEPTDEQLLEAYWNSGFSDPTFQSMATAPMRSPTPVGRYQQQFEQFPTLDQLSPALRSVWMERMKIPPEQFFQELFAGSDVSPASSVHIEASYNEEDQLQSVEFSVSLRNADGTPLGTLDRNFLFEPDGTIRVDHVLFSLNPGAQAGELSKSVLSNGVRLYDQIGVTQVQVHAALTVGGYAWAKYGFAPDTPQRTAELFSQIKSRLNKNPDLPANQRQIVLNLLDTGDPQALWAISDLAFPVFQPDGSPRLDSQGRPLTLGKALLLGTNWYGVLDLTDPVSRQRFEQYVYGGSRGR